MSAIPGIAGAPDHLKPALRVFLSADMVGSTALKQSDPLRAPAPGGSASDANTRWLSVIRDFYASAVQTFDTMWSRAAVNAIDANCFDNVCGTSPRLWKTIGDEVVFYKDLTCIDQLPTLIWCWQLVLDEVRRSLRSLDERTSAPPRLDVKSTVWIAGFPRRNKAVPLPRQMIPRDIKDAFLSGAAKADDAADDVASTSYDFVGPGIDIGFRLAKFATPDRIPISLDVAYILSLTTLADDPEYSVMKPNLPLHARHVGAADALHVRYDGNVRMKGVLGEREYPLFWIASRRRDRSGSLASAEESLRGAFDKTRLREFCRAFYEEHRAFLHAPFISSEAETRLTEMPAYYAEWLGQEIAHFRADERAAAANRATLDVKRPDRRSGGFGAAQADAEAARLVRRDDDAKPPGTHA